MDPVDQLYDKFFGKIKHEAVKLKREAKRIAELETPLEKSLREATSNQNWGCPNSILYELALACQSYSDRQKILKKCWERLDSKEDKWRRVLKTLILIDYLLKNGPEQVVQELQGEQAHFRKLLSFKCMEDGQDRGGAIRDRARNIMDLLSDRDRIKEEREKAKEHQSKFRQGAQMPSSSSEGRGTKAVSSIASSLGISSSMSPNAGGISRNKFEEKFNQLKQQKEREQQPHDRGQFEGADSLHVADEESPDGGRRRGDRRDDRQEKERSDDRQRKGPLPKVAPPGSGSRSSGDRPGLPAANVSGSDDSDDGGERPASAPPMSDLLDMGDGPAPARASAAAPAPPPPPGPAGPSMARLPPPGAARAAPAAPASSSGGLDDLLGGSDAPAAAAPAAAAPPPSEDLFGDATFQGAAPAGGGGGFFPGNPAPAPAGGGGFGGAAQQEDLFGGFQGTAAGPPAFQAAAPQPNFFAAPGPPAPMPAPAPAAFQPLPRTAGGMPPLAAPSPAAQVPIVNEDLMSKNLRELNLAGDSGSSGGQAAAAGKGAGKGPSIPEPGPPKSLDIGDAFEVALGGGR